MRLPVLLLPVLLLAALAVAPAAAAHAADWDRPGWELTFHDEFDGAELDRTAWVTRFKWGEARVNGELQAYVDDAFSVDAGVLSITGEHRDGDYAGETLPYRSGVLCSVHEQRYGYFEARLQVPAGRGLWPAFWMLGATGTSGVNEIDVHEILGQEPTRAYQTIHWGSSYTSGHQSDGSSVSGTDFSAGFHTFGLEWSPDAVIWTIDGVEVKRYSGPGIPQVDMYLIMNLAIGGNWPGAPDGTTPFPARYRIDYVRAYTKVGGDPAPTSSGSGGCQTGDAGALAALGLTALARLRRRAGREA